MNQPAFANVVLSVNCLHVVSTKHGHRTLVSDRNSLRDTRVSDRDPAAEVCPELPLNTASLVPMVQGSRSISQALHWLQPPRIIPAFKLLRLIAKGSGNLCRDSVHIIIIATRRGEGRPLNRETVCGMHRTLFGNPKRDLSNTAFTIKSMIFDVTHGYNTYVSSRTPDIPGHNKLFSCMQSMCLPEVLNRECQGIHLMLDAFARIGLSMSDLGFQASIPWHGSRKKNPVQPE